MRFRLLSLALGALLLGSTAQANTINFGTATNNSTCSLAGNSGDRSCSNAININNGANDASASLAITGQASADHGITTNPTAIADMTVSYTIPYTVTRTVSITGGPIPTLSIPNQQITFNLNLSGEVSKDNSQATGGLGQALLDITSFNVSTTRFGSVTFGNDISQTGGGGLARSPFNFTVPDISGAAGRTFDGAAGEISFGFEIPTNYRDWDDFVAPFATNYQTPQNFVQSFTDTLTISFRLRAESRPSGSISATGGEALACAGQTSSLGSFALDNSANCGSGFTVAASVAQTGLTTEPVSVPEPATLVLIGLGVAGIAVAGRRRQA